MKTILVSILLLVTVGSVTGIPLAIHLCCGVPEPVGSVTDDCCGGLEGAYGEESCDTGESGEGDDCCETQISVGSIDEDATLAPCPQPEQILNVMAVVPIHRTTWHEHSASVMVSICFDAHPPPPPERSQLSVYLI